MCFEKPFLPLIIYCNGCHMTFLSCKNPVSPFITLNHFLQISQDYIYWIHLSFSCWSCGQRRIASPTRFKDFLRPTPQDWRSFILLTSNHISNLWTHVTYKYATRQNTHFFILLTVFTPLLWCLLCLRQLPVAPSGPEGTTFTVSLSLWCFEHLQMCQNMHQ